MTSRRWRESMVAKRTAADLRLIRFGWITVGLVYVQLVLGSFLRHATTTASRDQFRLWVVFHILVAVVVTVHLMLWVVKAHRTAEIRADLKWPARWLAALIVVQLALGLATWVVNYGWPVWFHGFEFAAAYRIQAQGMLQSLIVTGHVANGSLLLAIGTTLATRQSRLLRGAPAESTIEHRTLQGVLA